MFALLLAALLAMAACALAEGRITTLVIETATPVPRAAESPAPAEKTETPAPETLRISTETPAPAEPETPAPRAATGIVMTLETATPVPRATPVGATPTPIPTETPEPTPTPTPAPTPTPQQVRTPQAAPREGETILTISFTGDVTLGSQEVNMGKENSFHGYVQREGYGWFFKNMKALFTTDDLTLVNLEGVLSDSALMEDTRKTFRFRGPTYFAQILTSSGIEACAISNNHTMDYGRQGYESTVRTLQDYGILYCGNDYSFVFEKDGAKVGFFALGSSAFYTYSDKVKAEIARMRQEGVGAIVCCFHAGQEYLPRRRDRDQQRFARIAVEEWGADLVVMHHPHVLQGIDVLDNHYVFYSLGNFCFGGNMTIRASDKDSRVRTLESMVLQIDLHFTDTGVYLGQEGRIYPCYISSSATKVNDPNDFQPKFVTGAQAQGVLDRIQYDTKFALEPLEEGADYVRLPFLEAPGTEKDDFLVSEVEVIMEPSAGRE